MRNISTALQAHIASEVTTLCLCIEITRNDGVVLRLTDSDRDVVVNGETYVAGCSFNMSAIKAGSDLSVDNATIDIGVDGYYVKKADLTKDLLRRAPFYLFSVNWASPSDGTIDLKRGWVGDAILRDQDWITLSLRGLTQALQRNILSQYSPTCRADFGDAKCGVSISPVQLRRNGVKYKTGDWVYIPDPADETNVPLTNGSFDTGTLASWSTSDNSAWNVVYTPTGYVADAGDPTVLSAGNIQSLWQEMPATVTGMSSRDIDDGAYMLSLSAVTSATDPAHTGDIRARIVFYDNSGREIGSAYAPWFQPEFGRGQEIGIAAFVPPNTRKLRFYIDARKGTGRIYVECDDVRVKYYSDFTPVVHKCVRIPSRLRVDAVGIDNYRFVEDGLVSDGNPVTGWNNSHFRVVTAFNGLSPVDGAYFLVGGDNGSMTGAQTYAIDQTIDVTFDATVDNLFEASVAFAHTEALTLTVFTATFLDSAGAVISYITSGATAPSALNSWESLRISGPLPVTTASVRFTITGTSGASSALNAAYDSVVGFIFNSAVPGAKDSLRGYSAEAAPSFDTLVGDFTYDGDLIWLAQTAPFSFDTVDAVADRRVFTGTDITGGDYAFYGAKITWLSGANAGSVSYVRTWVQGTKTLKLYTGAGDAIASGDRFMYSLGCNKTIADCSSRFNNVINFRGEPYLPGVDKALTFFTNNAN